MSDTDRLIGALAEFKESQKQANIMNQQEHKEMMAEIAGINRFRWKIDGARLLFAAVAGILGGSLAKAAFSSLLQRLAG